MPSRSDNYDDRPADKPFLISLTLLIELIDCGVRADFFLKLLMIPVPGYWYLPLQTGEIELTLVCR